MPKPRSNDPYGSALILQGVDYATAWDKSLMNYDSYATQMARGGLEATMKALGIYLGVDPAQANEMILMAAEGTP